MLKIEKSLTIIARVMIIMITIMYKFFAKLILIDFSLKINNSETPCIYFVSTNSDRSPGLTTRKTFAIYYARKLYATLAAKYFRVPVVADICIKLNSRVNNVLRLLKYCVMFNLVHRLYHCL